MPSMTPLVVVDTNGHELGRCSIENGQRFEGAQSVDLGPVGYFRILDVHPGDPTILVAEPAQRKQWAYEIVIRSNGIEQRRALLDECSPPLTVGATLKWPPQRGQTPVDHQIVEIRPSTHDRSNEVAVIERPA
jgi:hypothetical protein